MKSVPRLQYLIAFAMLLASLPVRAAAAEDVTAFYNGKNLNLVVGFNAGGGADLYARLIARHFGKHIPGHPNIVVRNMPGAGSMGQPTISSMSRRATARRSVCSLEISSLIR